MSETSSLARGCKRPAKSHPTTFRFTQSRSTSTHPGKEKNVPPPPPPKQKKSNNDNKKNDTTSALGHVPALRAFLLSSRAPGKLEGQAKRGAAGHLLIDSMGIPLDPGPKRQTLQPSGEPCRTS